MKRIFGTLIAVALLAASPAQACCLLKCFKHRHCAPACAAPVCDAPCAAPVPCPPPAPVCEMPAPCAAPAYDTCAPTRKCGGCCFKLFHFCR